MKSLQIKLKKEEREFLENFIKKGTKKAREIARANVLLLLNEGWEVNEISKIVKVHRQRIWRIKKRFLKEGLEITIKEKPRSGQPRKYTKKHEAEIIAHACTSVPKGRKRWTVRLLTKEIKKKNDLTRINRESVRLVLKKAKLSLG
jgi:putative transposase